MDCIRIKDLEVFGYHGAKPEENVLGQKFVLDVKMYTDTRKAGLTDDLTKSIHYGHASKKIEKFVRENTYQLIETLAEKLAEFLLKDTENLWKVDVVVKKPWAPIKLPVDTVSVGITRSWHKAVLSIGSNLGDRENFLNMALSGLEKDSSIRNIKKSDFIETKAYGKTDQPDFLNGCVTLETLYTPEELLELLHQIEQFAHRERKEHWGPRTLDMDILLYDDLVMESDDLIIPHIDMENRKFVLEPLCQILPNKRHPVLKKTIKQLLMELENKANM